MKAGGKHIPRAEEAHLSVGVSRGPWSRTPGPLALVPEAAIILRPHKLFPTLQRNPKKAEVRNLRATTRGAVIVTRTSALLSRFLQMSASVLISKSVPGISTYECSARCLFLCKNILVFLLHTFADNSSPKCPQNSQTMSCPYHLDMFPNKDNQSSRVYEWTEEGWVNISKMNDQTVILGIIFLFGTYLVF